MYKYCCPLCGINVNRLPENKRVSVDNKNFCIWCYRDKKFKMKVSVKDFGAFAHKQPHTAEGITAEAREHSRKEAICKKLPSIEIAHLYGDYGREDAMDLDFFYDEENDEPYFRLCIIDDDDPWWGSELYAYIEAEAVPVLLRKNGIHYFDGMTKENYKSFIKVK